jgi:hypothetical protein
MSESLGDGNGPSSSGGVKDRVLDAFGRFDLEDDIPDRQLSDCVGVSFAARLSRTSFPSDPMWALRQF